MSREFRVCIQYYRNDIDVVRLMLYVVIGTDYNVHVFQVVYAFFLLVRHCTLTYTYTYIYAINYMSLSIILHLNAAVEA